MPNIELNDKEFAVKYPGIIEILLLDRTTKKNLIYGTSNYLSKGHRAEDQIEYSALINAKKSLIRPRIEKSKAEQKKRSKDAAEVFTPSWVCNLQNNLVDEDWFGHKGSFNEETEQGWKTNSKIDFGDKSWKKYVDLERIEITCGEAPYLVSRYDAVQGTEIEVKDRIGLFDRKLRAISENTEDQKDYLSHAFTALKRVYGFDFQGDNVFLARRNLFLDFIEFYQDKFGEEPSLDSLKEAAKIISYNIFQMDGMKFVIPFSCHKEEPRQLSLFEDMMPEPEICYGCKTGDITRHNGIYATIRDWRNNKTIKFIDVMK